MAFDLAVGTGWVSDGEVVHPTSQMPIQLSNQDWNRLTVLMTIRHLPQLLALPLDRLLRRKHIQVVSIASVQITVVPKCVTQEAQSYPFFPQVHHPRLFPVDLQLEFAFQPRFDELVSDPI